DLTSVPDRTMKETFKVSNEGACMHRFRVQFLPAGKGEKLCRQTGATIGGLSGGRRKLADAVVIAGSVIDEFEVSGNDHEQIVEVMGDTSCELADSLHLLALMKLLLDHAPRLDGLFMFGDVPEQDGDNLA